MASPPRVSFSGEHLELTRISQHHRDIEASVLEENERTTAMTILASLEAAFPGGFPATLL